MFLAFLGLCYSYDDLLLLQSFDVPIWRIFPSFSFFFYFILFFSLLLIATTRNNTGLSISSHRAPAVFGNHAHMQRRLPFLDELLRPGPISWGLSVVSLLFLFFLSILSKLPSLFPLFFFSPLPYLQRQPPSLLILKSTSYITVTMTSKMAHLLLENLKILVSWDGRMEHAAKITITVEVGAASFVPVAAWIVDAESGDRQVVSEPGNDLHLLNMEKSPFRFKKAVVDRVKFLAPDSASGSDTAAETTMGKTASKSISLEKLYGGWLPPSPPVRLFPSESASCDVVLPEVPPDAFEYVGERSSERPDCQRSLSGQSTLLSETQTSGDLDLQQTTAREKPQEATDSSSDSLAVRPLMVIKRTESNRRKRTARDAGLSDEDSNAAAGEIPSVDQLDSTQVYPDPPHEQPDEEEQKPASVEPVDAAFADLDLEGLLERNSTMSGESSLNQTNEKRHEARDPDGEPLASGCLGTKAGSLMS